MKKTVFILILLLGVLILNAQTTDFYSLTAKTIDGKDFSFEQLRGKRVLIVNVASKCGYTKQYKELQELHEKYGSEKFIMLGFPANNFLKQEPGSDTDILEFCTKTYNVKFQMMSKISVKDNDIHPVYQWLCSKSLNKSADYEVKWNFQKFFVDENGNHAGWAIPKTNPLHEDIIKWAKGEIKTVRLE